MIEPRQQLIIRKYTRKLSGELDFIRLKDFSPFDDYRQNSKAINFGLEFGMSAFSFGKNILKKSWNINKANDYIKLNGLSKELEKLNMKFEREEAEDILYICVASDIRKKFFQIYKGFNDRIEREHNFVKENGYVRAWHGALRRIPELFFLTKENKEYRKLLSNLLNISVNSAIQNFEAYIVYRTIINIYKYLKTNNKKSRILGTVHDSIDFYIHREEVEEITKLIYTEMIKQYDEYSSYPLDGDLKIADPKLGEIYKGGRKLKVKL